MKPSKYNPFRFSSRSIAAISIAFINHFTSPAAHAASATYYWDGNNGTTGFGTASGTWAAPTTGTATAGWSTSPTGATAISGNSVTTDTTDSLNFGAGTTGNGLNGGTISVSGAVAAGSLTYGSLSGNILLTGGTINLAAATTITTNAAFHTIASVLSGATTSLTKAGTGTLKITGANGAIAGGSFFINAGEVQVANDGATSTGPNTLGGSDGWTVQLGNTSGSSGAILSIGNSFGLANPITVRTGSSGTKTIGLAAAISGQFTGAITANDSLTILQDQNSNALTVSNAGNTVATGKTITFSNTGGGGAITDNATWSGLGKLAYNGNNTGNTNVSGQKTYSGGATLGTQSSTGVVAVSSNSTPTSGTVTSGPFGTGTLTLNGSRLRAGTTADITIGNPVTFSGNMTFPTATNEKSLILTGNADLGAASRTLTVDVGSTVPGKAVDFQGVISSATATSGLTKAGAGTLILSGANTYTGNTTVTGGTLNITGVYTGDPLTSSLLMGTTAANTVVNVSNDMTLFSMSGANLTGSSTAYNQTAGIVNVSPSSTTNFVAKIGYGYFNLTGGTFKQNTNRFSVTDVGTTAVGVAYIGGTGILDVKGATPSMIIGYSGTGMLTVGPGGSVDRNSGAASNFWLTTNAGSYGVLNIAGGNFDNTGSAIRVGNSTSGTQTGFINLAKGTLTIGANTVNGINAAGSSTFYTSYAGGTLKASANLTAVMPASNANLASSSTVFGPITNNNSTNTAFNTQIGTTSNFDGGLIVDSNSFDLTYTSPLLGSTGNGIKQTNLTVAGGTGYIGAPMVQFTGGTGTPASGYAVISGGAVTGIVITSPGDYSVDPTGVTLTGGGGTGASVALSALTANPTDSGLTKTNSGTLTLTAANTYAGPTTVNGGSLILGGSGSVNNSSGIAINGSGAKFVQNSTTASTPGITLTQGTLTGSGTVGAVSVADTTTAILTNNNGVPGATLTTGALTFNGPPTLNTYTSSCFAPIASASLFTNAAGTVTINPSATLWTNGATYDLISYGGGSIGGAGLGQITLGTITGLAARQSASALGDSGTAITLTISGDTPYWTGGGDGKWNLSSTNNWSLVSNNNSTVFLATDIVLFNDNAGGAGPISVDIDAANVAPTSTTFNNSTKDYLLGSSGGFGISSGILTKSGTGRLTITNVNTYSGTTTINGGTLVIDDGSIATSSNIVNNAALEYKLNTNARTYTNVISGSGTLTKSGTNTLTLSGANTFTGGLTVAAGTVTLGNAAAAGASTSVITFNTGGATNATAQFSGSSAFTVANPITVAAGSTGTNTVGNVGTGNLTLNGAITIDTGTTLTVNSSSTNNSALDFGTGGITGAGAVVVTGTSTGSIAVRGDSTYSGGFSFGGSGLLIPALSSTGPAGAPTSGPFGTGTVTLGAASMRSTTISDTTIANALTISGDLTAVTSSSEKSLNFSGPATLTGTRVINSSVGTTVAGKSLTFSGNIGDGGNAYGINKAGAGTLTLSGANTYTGATTVNAGTLSLGHAGALGSGPLVLNGGNLDSVVAGLVNTGNNVQTWNGDFAFTGTQSLNLGTGAVTMSANRAVTVTASTLTVGGSIGGGAVSLTKLGAGTLALSGSNTYSGTTTVSAGTLQIGAADNLGDGSATNTLTLGAATLDSTGGSYDLGVNRAITLSGAAKVQADAGTLTLSGDIANGASSLALLGAGNIVVSGVIGTGATPSGVLTIGSATLPANVTLSGSSLFTGNVSLPATNTQPRAVLTLTNSGALGLGPKTVTSTGANGTNGGEIHLQNNISLASNISFVVSGLTINNDSGSNTINGNISMASGSGDTSLTSTSGTLTINGNMSASNTLRQLRLRGNGNGLIAGVISNGTTVSLPVIKDAGTGTWTLTGVNTYTGSTTISAGTLVIDEGSIATSSSIVNNATLEYKLSTNARNYTNVISGTGNLVKSGTNTLTLSGANTYSGNTTVNAGTLALADNAQLKFVLGATSGSNNSISGAGTVTLDGDFVIDTTAADSLSSGTWTLENVASLTGAYGATFSVVGFTDAGGDKWTKVSGSKTYTFDETTGVLTLVSAAGYDSWATDKGLTGLPGSSTDPAKDADPDGDGHNNLYEFAFDGNPLAGSTDGKIVGKIGTVGGSPLWTLTLPVRNSAAFSASAGDQLSALVDGIYYRIEGDTDLGTFASTITEVTGGDATTIQSGLPALSSGWTYRTFSAPGPVSTVPKTFLRAKVSEAP